MREISIHAPAKGATARRRMMCRCVSNFNPRSREGSDAPCSSDRQSAFLFQSTLPRRERRRASCPSPRRSRYFNPRSREGSDAAGLHTAAPVRHFNPRSREGSDERPAQLWARLRHFNPRSREGSDGVCRAYAPEEGRFQSTLPRRERPYNRSGQLRDHRYFNPRSREGSDATFPRPRLRRDTRFQSTLPRRERPRWQARSSSSFPFQSTLPRRERPIITGLVTLVVLFQSTLPRRERPWHTVEIDPATLFQSTLPRRERLARRPDAAALSDFNPRSREGSDFICLFVMMILVDFNPRSREGSDLRGASS